ncbi:MAG: winged helix-turn-helix domain-containing protein, partial [Steroidobacteraceae bacterium]
MSEAKQQAQLTTQEVVAYRAGDLIIDTGRQLVTRGDQEIPLPRLSFDLLLALLRAAPNLVPLDGLMQQVWPNLVVSPETVSQRVKLLRDALEDDPRDPRYIAGLRGRGYRMLVPVARLASPTLQAPAPSETETPAKLRTSRRWMIALGALVLLVAA